MEGRGIINGSVSEAGISTWVTGGSHRAWQI